MGRRITSDQIEYTTEEYFWRMIITVIAILVLVSLLLVIVIGDVIMPKLKQFQNSEVKEICLDGYEEKEVLVCLSPGDPGPDSHCFSEIRKVCKSEPIKVWVQKE